MLLFMVAQLPGLIPHKLWASPHESTTTNHPTLRLLEPGKGPALSRQKRVSATRRARTWDDSHTGGSSRVPSIPNFVSTFLPAGSRRRLTVPDSIRLLLRILDSISIPPSLGHFKVHTPFWFWMVFLGQSVPGFWPPPPVVSSFGNHCPPSPSTSSIEHWFPYSVPFWSCIPCLKTCPLHNSLRLHHLRILRYLSNSRVGGLR